MLLKYQIFVLIFCFSSVTSTKQNTPIVSVSEGKLQGAVETLRDGSRYFSFKGIPFATPPTGNLRFQGTPVHLNTAIMAADLDNMVVASQADIERNALLPTRPDTIILTGYSLGIEPTTSGLNGPIIPAPKPPKSWNGILEAVDFRPICTQFNATSRVVEGEEDCLYLNVYTPTLEEDAKKPVMVYIYGGGFTGGSGDFYGPQFLIQHDVILVTFNHRLEVLGFLSLENPEVPGNAAMKDQVAALRWVQRNIAKFGGDPNSVTLFGESSGALCVFLHMLSPMSKGLFHRAIAESGTYEFAKPNGGKERAFRVGKLLGIETTDVQTLLSYLKGLSADELLNIATSTTHEIYRTLIAKFLPVVENKYPGVEAFLDEDPSKLIREGKLNRVPFIIGYNSGEGLIRVKYHIAQLKVYNETPSFYAPREISERISKKQLIEFGDRIVKFYVGDRSITGNDLNTIRDMFTDTFFAYTAQRLANLYSSFCDTYMYRFDFVTELNIVKHSLGLPNVTGASHGDEIFYLFNNYMTQDLYESQQKLRDIVFKVTKLWTNFAKSGQPTLDNTLGAMWRPYKASGKEYFKIDEPFSLGHYADRERMQFWNELYKEAGLLHISD